MGSAASSTSARSGGSEGPPHSTESDGSPPPPSTDSVSVPRNAIILGDDFLQRFGAGSGEPLRGEESRDSRSARPGASAKSPPPPPRDGASKSPATAQCGGGVEEDESYLLRPPPRPSCELRRCAFAGCPCRGWLRNCAGVSSAVVFLCSLDALPGGPYLAATSPRQRRK